MYLDRAKPYIVAELNSSHRGKVEIAKRMIDAAKECGCDAVKFQSWTPESLYCKTYYDQNPISKRIVKGFALSSESLKELADYCRKIDIDFSSTPYSKEEVDFLVDQCRAPFVKIASMDINNLPYLRYVARKMVPIVLSTGMATIDEIEAAVKVIEEEGNRSICILHCVSLYPVAPADVNLNNMVMLKDKFKEYEVGYSDHTMGYEVACAAVALGAVLIEKHFTLDNKMIGWDNQMATEPEEMKELVKSCRNVASSLGKYERTLTENEISQRNKMRRSIVAAHDLNKDHLLMESDIDVKRPGDGLSVSRYYEIIGKKLKCDILKDEMIFQDNIE
ncbi:N-acetylneuraminate synthase family protein [Lacrimispora saccharolytica]|uniref:N-acetylneuraminate synthase family protein n=1 Tax=Lacrimispora saccharolytica TaxID=84030 RepID=UPI00265C94EA|nr:N-acetylneuraminate synthase family protein [Lacrimispora saccharolytica]MCF2656987.1 N-acetylneuraminate synthase family protein [Lacrimispora saccharolytica]